MPSAVVPGVHRLRIQVHRHIVLPAERRGQRVAVRPLIHIHTCATRAAVQPKPQVAWRIMSRPSSAWAELAHKIVSLHPRVTAAQGAWREGAVAASKRSRASLRHVGMESRRGGGGGWQAPGQPTQQVLKLETPISALTRPPALTCARPGSHGPRSRRAPAHRLPR